MAYSASRVANEIASRRNGLVLFLNRMESLHVRGYLSKRDVERAYRGAFLEFCSHVENMIEKLFVGMLVGRYEHRDPQICALVNIRSDVVARHILYGGRRYVDWLPFDHTEERAKAFLARGRPFSDLNSDDKGHLKGIVVLRNALAHDSGHALRQFRKQMVNPNILPPAQQRPDGYLRGQYAVGSSRFQYMTARTQRVFQSLCNK
jgi:hypothetical protein